MKIKGTLFLALLLSGFVSLAQNQSFIAEQNKKSLALFNAVDEGKSVFLSPLGIRLALGIPYYASENDAKQQLETFLGIEKPSFQKQFGYLYELNNFTENNFNYQQCFKQLQKVKDTVTPISFTISNALLYNESKNTIDAEFLGFLKSTNIKADIFKYQSQNLGEVNSELNNWVNTKSHGLIKSLPSKVEENTVLGILNLIYFFAEWDKPFDKKLTKEEPFTLPNKKKVKVPTMTQTRYLSYAEDENYQVVSIPYQCNQFSMVVALPKNNTVEALSYDTYQSLFAKLQSEQVKLFFPKFKIESQIDLKKILVKQGLTAPFVASNNFPLLFNNGGRSFDEIIHQTVIQVDEEKTEAAALTAMMVTTSYNPTEPIVFRADHSFSFFIVDNNTNLIVFAGRFSGE